MHQVQIPKEKDGFPRGRIRRRPDGAFLVAAILLAIVVPAIAEQAKSGVERANELYVAEEFEKAAGAYSQILKTKPSPEVFMNLGHCRLRLKQFAQAAEAYGKALELDAAAESGHWLLAQALFGAEQYEEAIGHFHKAAPGKGEAFLWIGQSYEHLDDPATAEVAYREGALRRPAARICREALAALYMRQKRCSEAERIYEALLRRHPDDAKLRKHHLDSRLIPAVERATEAYREGRFLRAAQLHEDAIDIQPSLQLLLNLGHCYLQAERPEEAAGAYRKALKLNPDANEVHTYLGRALFRAEKFAEAIPALRKAAESGKREDDSLLLGRAYECVEDLSSAENIYRASAGKNLSRRRSAEALAGLYAGQERFDELLKVYEALAARAPEDKALREKLREARAACYAQKGNAAVVAGNTEAAIKHFEVSVEAKPNADIYQNLGHLRCEVRKYPEAIEAYQEALELDPGRQELLPSLAQAYFESGSYGEAIQCAGRALKHKPSEEMHLIVGRSFEIREDWVSARLAYEDASLRLPESRKVREELADVYLRTARPKLAEEVLAHLARQYPGETALYRSLADARLAAGDYKKAIDALEMRRRLSPEDPEVYQTLADLYLSESMFQEAAQMYRLLLALNARPSAEDYFRLAHAYYQAREWVSAEEALNRALKLDPSSAQSHLYLGHLRLKDGQEDAAVAAYTSALKADEGLAAAHSALADLFLRKKDYGRAAGHYQGVIASGETDPVVYRNAIISLFRSGGRDQAESVLKTALSRHPGHEDLGDLIGLFGKPKGGE